MKISVEGKKLHLIEEFLKIQDEHIINRIESVMKEERLKVLKSEQNTPYSDKEFNEMIDRAESDAAEGRVLTSKDVNKRIKSWK